MIKCLSTPCIIAFTTVTVFLTVQNTQAQNSSPYWSLAGNSNASTSSKLGTTNAINLRLFTRNVERMRIDTLGRVGIGTTTPSAPLDIRATSVGPLVRFNGASANLYLALYESSSYRGYIGSFAGNNEDVDFGTGGSNTTGKVHLTIMASPKLTVNAAGNVGIGTTAPTYKLHVLGNARFTAAVQVDNGGLKATNVSGAGVQGIGNNSSGTGVKGSGYFGVYGSGSNLGVYGISPNTGVYGKGDVYGLYGESNTSSGIGVFGIGSSIGIRGAGNTYGVLGTQASSTGYAIAGIGGYAAVYGSSSSYAAYFSGNVYTSGMYQGSDRKLKQNISDFSSAIDLISKLQPKMYEYRQDGNYKLMNLPQGKHYGLIAQDVEQVLPNLVNDTKFDTQLALLHTKQEPGGIPNATETAQQPTEVITFKAVNYMELIPILVKAMQEINEKTKHIDELEIKNQQLEDRLNKLEALISGKNYVSSTAAYLEQNTPNPVNGTTSIRYHVPEAATSALLNITDVNGQLIKTMQLSKGAGQTSLNTSALAAGTYNYTLYVDGKPADTRRLVIAR